MKKVSIFVAGAKDLKEQRLRLKALANDLSDEYSRNGEAVNVHVCSYENFGDNQIDYDAFIEHTADLVIFVLKDRIGSKTEEEFLLAAKRYRQSGTPEIMVFLHTFDEKTPEIGHIEGLVNATLEKYYTEYSSTDELIFKAKERIEKFVTEKYSSKSKPLIKSPKERGRLSKLTSYLGWFVAFLLLVLFLFRMLFPSTKPVLLFAGGGTVDNYIRRYHSNVDIRNYHGSIYAHMPSSNAWFLLTEEVLTPQTTVNNEVMYKFFPICLSSEKATESSFLSVCTKEQFMQVGHVISLLLGNDTLRICAKKTEELSRVCKNLPLGYVTTGELAELLDLYTAQQWNIFNTSVGSGTRQAYQTALTKYGCDFSVLPSRRYTAETGLDIINAEGEPYVVLGSECYMVNQLAPEIRNGSCVSLQVVDDQNNFIMKPIYLYFIAYNHSRSRSNDLWIPEETVSLLKDLEKKLDRSITKNIKDNMIKRYSQNLILSLDSVPAWE